MSEMKRDKPSSVLNATAAYVPKQESSPTVKSLTSSGETPTNTNRKKYWSTVLLPEDTSPFDANVNTTIPDYLRLHEFRSLNYVSIYMPPRAFSSLRGNSPGYTHPGPFGQAQVSRTSPPTLNMLAVQTGGFCFFPYPVSSVPLSTTGLIRPPQTPYFSFPGTSSSSSNLTRLGNAPILMNPATAAPQYPDAQDGRFDVPSTPERRHELVGHLTLEEDAADMAKNAKPVVVQRKRNMQCSKCDRRCSSRSELQIHSRVHTGECPYRCMEPGCGKKFRWRSSMKAHAISHRRARATAVKPLGIQRGLIGGVIKPRCG